MKLKILFLLIVLSAASQSFAQSHKNEIGLQSDNDSYLGQGSDRYYTDGIFLYFRQALKIKDADTARLKNKVLGFEVGQKIFNPQGGNIPGPTFIDRPFAGYLYAGATLNFLYSNESNIKLSAQIGVVGPGADGKEVQTAVHKFFGFYKPTSWEYQVEDGAELNLSADYNRLLTRKGHTDLTLVTHADLGNGFTGANAGLMVRLGNFNQLFNSISTQSTVSRLNPKTLLHQSELFFYYKPTINYIAYDATIQGSLFTKRNPSSIEVTANPKPVVLSNEIGGAYTSNNWVLHAAVIFHTKEVDYMVRSHQWASITLLYRFN